MGYKKFNIYEGVNISEKLLSFGIILGIVALTAMIIIGSRAGLTASFVSEGGEKIALQHLRYGQHVKEPNAPTRSGYTFIGWYKDSEGKNKFDFASERLQDDVTLYAGWQKNSSTDRRSNTEKKMLY